MKPKENYVSKFRMTPSPSKQLTSQFNPENNVNHSGKRTPYLTNSSDNLYSMAIFQNKNVIDESNCFSSIEIDRFPSKSQINTKHKIQKLQAENRVLTQGTEQLMKQNMQLMQNNGVLKNQLFKRQEDKIVIKRLQQEIFRLEREMEGLERQVKEKTNFINIQMTAKEHHSKIIADMNFQIKQMHHLYDSQKQKNNMSNIKIKKLQEELLKVKKRVKQLQTQKSKQMNQSTKGLDRQNQNLKEKIKVLEGINNRQKQQITDLLLAMGPRQNMHSTTSSDLKLQIHNQPFQNQYSQILHRCVTQNDQQLKTRITQLQNQISELKLQNTQLKQKHGNPKTTNNTMKSLNNLILQKQQYQIQRQQYQIQLQQLHHKLVNMNEQLFQMNHQNHVLKQQKQHYQKLNKQMQLSNFKLAQQLTNQYNQRINGIERIKCLQEEINKHKLLQQDHQLLQEQYQCIKQNNQESQLIIEELNRKNKQLLIYVEELRISQQNINNQLIEKGAELQQLKSNRYHNNKNMNNNNNIDMKYQDESKIQRLLRERNIKILNGLNKFKQTVINQVKMMELELLVAQNTCKGQDTKDVLIKLKRRLNSILDNK